MLLSTLVAFLIAAQSPHSAGFPAEVPPFDLAPREEIEARLRRFSLDNAAREAVLKRMFKESGCKPPALKEQPVERERLPNIVCSLPGASNSIIMIAAHFDHVK